MPGYETPSLFRETMAEFGSIPRRGLIYLGIFAIIVAAIDLLTWAHRPTYSATDYAILAAATAAWVAVAYSISMLMIESPPSLRGLVKFLASSIALVLLPVIGFASLLAGLSAKMGAVAALGAALIAAGLVVGSLLVGWPILEATSQRRVGPLQAIRLTHGLRWQLFAAWLVLGGMTRGVPDTSSTDDFGTAVLLAAVNALASTLVSMIALSIAVAAYKFMTRERSV